MRYDPSEIQQEFHALTVDEALLGGAAGGGKSRALIADPLAQVAIEHARCKAGEVKWGQSTGSEIHFRRELPRLEENIHYACLLYKQFDPGFTYKDLPGHTGVFSSGYRVKFGHLKDSDSYLNYRSNSYTHMTFDELIEFEKDQYLELTTRCRSTDPVLSKMLRVRAATNPAPNWVRDYFVDPAPRGRTILTRRLKLDDGTSAQRTRMFLPAKLSDNPDQDFRRQYQANLLAKPKHIRAAQLDGDWYVVVGAFFADSWDADRVVRKPFKIPSEWKRFRSGDWGYKEECVVLWWAVSPDGDLICYRELTLNGKKANRRHDAYEVAEKIRDIEIKAGEWNTFANRSRLRGPMDTQLWEERGHRGPTMADDMAKVGVYWDKATKGRKQAAQQIVRRLGERGPNDEPGLMFFENAAMCIKTIPAIGVDPLDGEKPADGGPDHWLAAVMYACAANPRPLEDGARFDDDDDEFDQQPDRREWGQYGYGSN